MFCESDADRLLERFSDKELRWKISDTNIEFLAKPIDVIKAEFITEQILSCCGTVSIYDFLTHLGISEDLISIPLEAGLPDVIAGWCTECFMEWDSPWLDFHHEVIEDGSGIIFIVCFGRPSCYNIEDCPGSSKCVGMERGIPWEWKSQRASQEPSEKQVHLYLSTEET